VLEIGAGLGFLTSLLAEKAGQVLAVELDTSLVKVLEDRFRGQGNVRVIRANALSLPSLVFHKVVSNPPYNISSPLLLELLGWKFGCATLTLQREFAEKLVAVSGTKEYGPIRVLAEHRGKIHVLEHVPRSAFYPQPRVESAVVRIEPLASPAFHVKDEEVFRWLVRTLFTQRRRKARNGLQLFLRDRVGAGKKELPTLLELFQRLDVRVYELSPSEFGELANKAADLVRGKRVEYCGHVFYVFPEVYEPSDDSFLIARHLAVTPGQRILDMGTGCGLLGVLAALKGGVVTAVDVNPVAVECSTLNARINCVLDRFESRFSDLFNSLGCGRYELVVFNPPYLPEDEDDIGDGLLEKAWRGGRSGSEVIERFLASVDDHLSPNGQVMMVLSSLSRPEKCVAGFEGRGFVVEVVERLRLDFEELTLVRAWKSMI
jgi:ribosomal RNA small subunit methyltransferase A